MELAQELLLAGRIPLAAFLGGLIGWERERIGRTAGIRTYASVCMGSCVFGLVSDFAQGNHDITRIAAQVVSGVGFLGTGVILNDKGRIKGLTTAASLWTSASVGLSVAFGMFWIAIAATLTLMALLWAPDLDMWHTVSPKYNKRISAEGASARADVPTARTSRASGILARRDEPPPDSSPPEQQ